MHLSHLTKMKFFFLLICFSLSLRLAAYEYDLAICMMFRNEAPYLKEWIEYHKIVGAKHFYLYNNLSNDNYQEVLAPYVVNGEVELFEWDSLDDDHFGMIHTNSYRNAVKRALGKVQWLAVLDSDEFLVPTQAKNLIAVLNKYSEYGGLVVNWQMYGTSSVSKIPADKTQIESLCFRAESNWGENIHVKSIVRPERINLGLRAGWTEHSMPYKAPFYAVNSDYKRVDGPFSEPVVNKIRINHYWTRDEEYFINKKIPRRISLGFSATKEEMIENIKNYDKVYDPIIMRFVPELRKRLGLAG